MPLDASDIAVIATSLVLMARAILNHLKEVQERRARREATESERLYSLVQALMAALIDEDPEATRAHHLRRIVAEGSDPDVERPTGLTRT